MKLTLLTGAAMAAMLAAAVPAWADKGHGYWEHHHFRDYLRAQYWHHPPKWGHYRYKPRHYVYRYYEPYAYAVPAPAPGVHIVLPNVYIPFWR